MHINALREKASSSFVCKSRLCFHLTYSVIVMIEQVSFTQSDTEQAEPKCDRDQTQSHSVTPSRRVGLVCFSL